MHIFWHHQLCSSTLDILSSSVSGKSRQYEALAVLLRTSRGTHDIILHIRSCDTMYKCRHNIMKRGLSICRRFEPIQMRLKYARYTSARQGEIRHSVLYMSDILGTAKSGLQKSQIPVNLTCASQSLHISHATACNDLYYAWPCMVR